jgi:hypothetical protein
MELYQSSLIYIQEPVHRDTHNLPLIQDLLPVHTGPISLDSPNVFIYADFNR